MHYSSLKHLVRENTPERGYVCLPQDLFRSLLKTAIKSKGLFDERFYLEKNADVAAAVLFLASEGAAYITGATLHVNGGMHMD